MRDFVKIFDPKGVQSVLASFHKNHIPATFGGHLEFLCKIQKRIYLVNSVRQSDFDKIFDPQGMCRVYWRLFAKITFPPLLAAILNFYVKRKSAFILETVRHRAISMKFWTHKVSAQSAGDFMQKIAFLPLLSAILNFCVKHKSTFISETV